MVVHFVRSGDQCDQLDVEAFPERAFAQVAEYEIERNDRDREEKQ
jgi:hypothetical protein